MSDSSPRAALVTRDHVLTALVGILAGFIGGYYAAQKETAPIAMPPGAAAAAPANAAGAPPLPPEMQAKLMQMEELYRSKPDDVELQVSLGNAHYDAGNFQRALELYQKAVVARPQDANLLTDMGVCYRNIGDSKNALAHFERASAADPKHWQSRYNMAIIYSFDQRESEKALAVLAELKKFPEAAEAVAQLERAIAAHAGSS